MDSAPYETQDDLAKQIGVLFQTFTSTCQDIVALQGEITDPVFLASVLADWRDGKQDVARGYDDAEQALLAVAGDRKYEVPNLGLVEIKSSVRRTRWQHDEVFRSVIARIADEPGVFYDEEDGCRFPPAQLAANLVARLRDVLSPSWKVTGLRDLGLDPDEFADVDEKSYSVKLPSRNEAAA